MSLQAAARHMASQGRGPDTTLVHMSPKEVRSLQELAMAHGGSLTVNPQTGLPEAGFLSSILPMLAGMFLGPAGAGIFGSAMTAGLGVGALTGVATGSLRKGLMAGLGAYGGAGLGSAISGAGSGAIAQGAGTGAGAGATMPDFLAPGIDSPAGSLAPTGASGFGGMAPAAPAPDAGFLQSSAGTMQSGAPLGSSGSAGMDRFLGADGLTSTPYPSQAVAPPATAMPSDASLVAPRSAPPALQPVTQAPAIPEYSPQPSEIAYEQAQREQVQALDQAGPFDKFKRGISAIGEDPSKLFNKANLKYGLAAAAPLMFQEPKKMNVPKDSEQMRYAYSPNRLPIPTRAGSTGEYTYFEPGYTRLAAEGGTMTSDYTYDPQTMLYKRVEPVKAPEASIPAQRMIAGGGGGEGPSAPITSQPANPNSYTNGILGALMGAQSGAGVPVDDAGTMLSQNEAVAADTSGGTDYGASGFGEYAKGGISHLGDYSDGGRLLRGPGDGVSDSIPATIANKRPARLADGEFVVPARIVSELGNGSTEAGARKLYAMMDRIQKNRSKSVGKGKVAVNSRSEKMLPA